MNKWFVDVRDTNRVDLEDGQWIDIKRNLSAADQDYLARETISLELNMGGDNEEEEVTTEVPTVNVRSSRRRREQAEKKIKTAKMMPAVLPLLRAIIVDWSFCDNRGKKVPVNDANVGNLKREISNIVQDAWMTIELPLDENVIQS